MTDDDLLKNDPVPEGEEGEQPDEEPETDVAPDQDMDEEPE